MISLTIYLITIYSLGYGLYIIPKDSHVMMFLFSPITVPFYVGYMLAEKILDNYED